jgi:hypothetical protein
MRIVEAKDWKDAAITLLEPRSPYRPWLSGPELPRPEERILAVLRTDPVSVLTTVGYADARGNASFGRYTALDLLDVKSLALIADVWRPRDLQQKWVLDESTADAVEGALEDLRFHEDPLTLFGHTSLAKARIVLKSRGTCAGCDKNIGLRGLAARDRIHVHTVDPPTRAGGLADWPAVVCKRCRGAMGDNFLDFRFARHPQCPQCHGSRTMKAMFGVPVSLYVEPWRHLRRRSVSEEEWTCSECGHMW